MNAELKKLCNWFAANKLSLNVAKTNDTLFNTKSESRNDCIIRICNTEIEKVGACKFVGLIVDEKLNWKHHINYVQTKLSKTKGIFLKFKFVDIVKLTTVLIMHNI